MKKKLMIALFACSVAGCAPMPGSVESSTSPRLSIDNEGVTKWDNPTLFGPVPPAMAAKAAQSCATLDKKDVKHQPVGYHSRALDIFGNPLPEGGFYCLQN